MFMFAVHHEVVNSEASIFKLGNIYFKDVFQSIYMCFWNVLSLIIFHFSDLDPQQYQQRKFFIFLNLSIYLT